ncbi:uncharacterized protein BYT42DRAFT_501030 [Radiomyces spectabilis]|uniref:uncharacterized protein n=1 Tax=Radiomyces spectabilis TaxID=64574 RepID=UPI00221EB3E5|nr:uncharacterized protein BYT42DRAFT_501030 [Radiomyces spectabilis]KAI8373002.1 hypothetical protein BYT42DRAFT_501030 [Radiomyces spectabilis]
MTDVTSSTEPPANKIPTKTLLTTAVGVFGASFMGAIWYTKRKQSREMAQAMAEATAAESVPNSNAASWKPPKMSPAEYAAAKRDATFFAFKTLGYGTLLAFGSFGLMATAVGYWLDVRNVSDLIQFILRTNW